MIGTANWWMCCLQYLGIHLREAFTVLFARKVARLHAAELLIAA